MAVRWVDLFSPNFAARSSWAAATQGQGHPPPWEQQQLMVGENLHVFFFFISSFFPLISQLGLSVVSLMQRSSS